MSIVSRRTSLTAFCTAAVFCFGGWACIAAAAPNPVEQAQSISAQTGRPILGVVTNKQCKACDDLIEKLGTDRKLLQWSAAFVPLKLDSDSAYWQPWLQKYRPEGKTLPMIYIIRADGEMLFGKSVDPKEEDALIALMQQQLAKCGRQLSNEQAQVLTAAVAEAKKARAEADDFTAAKVLISASKSAKIEPLGQLGSYSKLALEADELYKGLVATGTTRINESKDLLFEGGADAFFAALNLAEAVRAYSPLPGLRSLIGQTLREVKRGEKSGELYIQAEQVDKAVSLAKGNKFSAARALEKLAERYAGTPAGEEARRRYEEFAGKPLNTSPAKGDQPDEPATGDTRSDKLRVWTDQTGKFRIRASLVEVSDGLVKLRKGDGKVIEVPLSKLSDADQKFLER